MAQKVFRSPPPPYSHLLSPPPSSTLLSPPTPSKLNSRQRRRNLYQEGDTRVGLTTRCTRDSCIGWGTTIGDGATVHCSTIGRGCDVGAAVVLSGCYVHDGAVIEAEAVLDGVVVCPGARVRAGARVGKGCVIGPHVVVGINHKVPPGTVLTLCRRPDGRDDESTNSGWSDDGEEGEWEGREWRRGG